jgi:hypothetical protein
MFVTMIAVSLLQYVNLIFRPKKGLVRATCDMLGMKSTLGMTAAVMRVAQQRVDREGDPGTLSSISHVATQPYFQNLLL